MTPEQRRDPSATVAAPRLWEWAAAAIILTATAAALWFLWQRSPGWRSPEAQLAFGVAVTLATAFLFRGPRRAWPLVPRMALLAATVLGTLALVQL